MSEKIDYKLIREFSQKLKNDTNFEISKNALFGNDLYDLVIDRKCTLEENNKICLNLRSDNVKITNQKNSGRCWIFATLNMVRDYILDKYNCENFELSKSYIAYFDKYEKANFFLRKVVENKKKKIDEKLWLFLNDDPVSDGGYFETSLNLIKKYGLVPQNIMPETFASKNTTNINKIIDLKLKEACLKIENEMCLAECYLIQKETMKTISKILDLFYGEIPTTFNVEIENKDSKNKKIIFKNVTPQTFLKKIKFNLDNYVTFLCSPMKKIKSNQKYEIKHTEFVEGFNNISFYNVDKTLFKFLLIAMLFSKKSCWFACDIDHFFDKNFGIWNTNMYDFDDFFGINFSKDIEELMLWNFVSGNHAMLFQGLDYDKEKWKNIKKRKSLTKQENNISKLYKLIDLFKINRFLVENSWGEKNGNKGMYIIDYEWFEKYVYEIVVDLSVIKKFCKNMKIFTKKEQLNLFKLNKNNNLYKLLLDEILNSKEELINIWDSINLKTSLK